MGEGVAVRLSSQVLLNCSLPSGLQVTPKSSVTVQKGGVDKGVAFFLLLHPLQILRKGLIGTMVVAPC